MTDRERRIKGFLTIAGWDEASIEAIDGDLSARRYSRLKLGNKSAVLMDADNPMEAFQNMTGWLSRAGASVPEIFFADAQDGLILLEDFGERSMSKVIAEKPEQSDGLYRGCVDLLLALRNTTAPDGLLRPDSGLLVEWTRLADEHFPGIATKDLGAFRYVLEVALKEALNDTPSVSLRDFHADNIMWLPDRHGIRKFGLLDYQDAFLTHPMYDLVSLLTDARTEISHSLREHIVDLYLERSGDNVIEAKVAFAALSAQRNLRILGIFARSAAQGKPQHLDKSPRVMRYLFEALAHPLFDNVREETLCAIPGLEAAHDT